MNNNNRSPLVDANIIIRKQDEWGFLDFGEREFTPDAIDALLNEVQTIGELAEGLGISYDTLVKAVREGRIQARQAGSKGDVWLSTIAAVKAAIKAGTIRPRNKE